MVKLRYGLRRTITSMSIIAVLMGVIGISYAHAGNLVPALECITCAGFLGGMAFTVWFTGGQPR